MEPFTWDPRRWQIARVIGRNPLLRGSDRVDALVTLIAVLLTLLAVPMAGVAASAVYAARDRQYTHEALTRHPVTATVVGPGAIAPEDPGDVVAEATWATATGARTGAVRSTGPLARGDRVEIWVDERGDPVAPPTPAFYAAIHAVGAGLGILLSVALVVGYSAFVTHVRVEQAHEAQWEREIQFLQGHGGRASQQ